MRRFLGTYYHTLDSKGRLSVPSKYRKDMGDTVVITRGHEGCLYLWPVDEWEKMAEELLALRQTASDPREYIRSLAMNADEVKIDSGLTDKDFAEPAEWKNYAVHEEPLAKPQPPPGG